MSRLAEEISDGGRVHRDILSDIAYDRRIQETVGRKAGGGAGGHLLGVEGIRSINRRRGGDVDVA